ncbi:MAG: hypothetical protein M1832_003137 [Thelocarpon impressellum]|nr:MAG: hypothetical protein M1832_003137 [Thelocarpon impressellum]
MVKDHLPNDEFFVQLASLFDARRQKDHGSVFLSQKRLTRDMTSSPTSPSSPLADLQSPATSDPPAILIRATNGKSKARRADKIKLSTVVAASALDGFFARYAEVCKAGMGALKKRDRSGRKKAKAKKRKGVEGEKKA